MQEVEAELDLPAPSTRSAAMALGLDSALIRAGIDLPFGGSLLAIARRPSAD